ncbi:hypothetical protein J4573_46150 [Actinomadura barringtoniae]|uniref:Secreted protein/lipoprotein n=1 Tax=Actinomadura barringtoniae TaxID=1427535 RepID=A0A939T9Q9_9ACTN|nr:hypothetical protein [Actinomadura barringtoniae]MBO2454539.1 hypothetical protein [Actinomadura barringtoniae]
MPRLRILAMTLLLSACAAACAPAGASGGFSPSGTYGPRGEAATWAATPSHATVLAAYRRFHQVFESVLETNDPSQISSAATGPEAARLTRLVRANRRAGVIQRSHTIPHPHVATLSAKSAEIIDCATTSGLWTYKQRSGARVGKPPRPRRYLLYVSLTATEGTWKVNKITYPKDPRC